MYLTKKQVQELFSFGPQATNVVESHRENPSLFRSPTNEEIDQHSKWMKYLHEDSHSPANRPALTVEERRKQIQDNTMLYLSGLLLRGIDGIRIFDLYEFITNELGIDVSTFLFNSTLESMKNTGMITYVKHTSVVLTPAASLSWVGIEKRKNADGKVVLVKAGE